MSSSPTQKIKFARNPQFRHVEVKFNYNDAPVFKKHFHGTFSVGVVEQGIGNFHYHRKNEVIGTGDIVLINPGEVHACNPESDIEWAYKMFFIDNALIQKTADELLGTTSEDLIFKPALVKNRSLSRSLHTLYSSILQSDTTLEKDFLILDILSQLILRYSSHRPLLQLPRRAFKGTQKAYEYLMDHLPENISLHDLASVSGLSRYHLLRVFQRRFGLPPHAFQIQKRITKAKKQLAQNIPPAQIAYDLGFTDQSHFTKRFKSIVGATPSQYQHAL